MVVMIPLLHTSYLKATAILSLRKCRDFTKLNYMHAQDIAGSVSDLYLRMYLFSSVFVLIIGWYELYTFPKIFRIGQVWWTFIHIINGSIFLCSTFVEIVLFLCSTFACNLIVLFVFSAMPCGKPDISKEMIIFCSASDGITKRLLKGTN